MINVFVTARIMYIVKTSKLVYIFFEGFERTKKINSPKQLAAMNYVVTYNNMRKKMLSVDS